MTVPNLVTASCGALYAADKAGCLDVQPVRISRGGPRSGQPPGRSRRLLI